MYIESNRICVDKTTQELGYVDDTVLMGRTIPTSKELYHVLENKGNQIGLNINRKKTKYMRLVF